MRNKFLSLIFFAVLPSVFVACNDKDEEVQIDANSIAKAAEGTYNCWVDYIGSDDEDVAETLAGIPEEMYPSITAKIVVRATANEEVAIELSGLNFPSLDGVSIGTKFEGVKLSGTKQEIKIGKFTQKDTDLFAKAIISDITLKGYIEEGGLMDIGFELDNLKLYNLTNGVKEVGNVSVIFINYTEPDDVNESDK